MRLHALLTAALFVVVAGKFDEGLPHALVAQILGLFDAVFLVMEVGRSLRSSQLL